LLDDGEDDEPLQAEKSVASVAQDATWQAPSQKRRREIDVSVSEIALVLIGLGPAGQDRGRPEIGRFFEGPRNPAFRRLPTGVST
jgi:hypothetical protein